MGSMLLLLSRGVDMINRRQSSDNHYWLNAPFSIYIITRVHSMSTLLSSYILPEPGQAVQDAVSRLPGQEFYIITVIIVKWFVKRLLQKSCIKYGKRKNR